jgi:hypothetical protein
MSDVTLCIGVCGVAPAVGKTTLAQGLDRWLGEHGHRVDLIEEDELLTRPELAPVARELAVTAHVQLETLVESVGTIMDAHAGTEGSVVVFDGLMPFVDVLLGWRYDEFAIGTFLDAMRERLEGHEIVVVYIDEDVSVALKEAADREPEGWLEWWVETLERRVDEGPVVHGFQSAADYLDWQRSLTLRLLEQHGWRVLVLGAAHLLSPEAVRLHAQDALTPLL